MVDEIITVVRAVKIMQELSVYTDARLQHGPVQFNSITISEMWLGITFKHRCK